MAFRRSVPSRGRSFKRRSFSKNRTHQPKRTGHWQRANLALEFENIVFFDDTAPINTVIVVAQIEDHLGDTAFAAGRLENNKAKFLEIGGIVFDWQMMISDVVYDFTSPPVFDQVAMNNQLLLVSDRMNEFGSPTSVTTDWFSNTTPIPLASATDFEDEDQRFPTRVHWRHARVLPVGYGQFPDVTGNNTPSQSVVHAQGSANLRLRLALDDEHLLAFHWTSSFVGSSSVVQAMATRVHVQGSLYWRVRY